MARSSEKKLRKKMHFLVNTWEELEAELTNAEKVLSDAHLEPPPSLKNKRQRRRAHDANTDGNLIPTPSTTSFDELNFWRERALEKVEGLRSSIRNRELSVELVLVWGAFQFASAMVLSTIFVSNVHEIRKRAGKESGAKVAKVVEKKWIARELQKLMDASPNLRRDQAEAQLARRIGAEVKTLGNLDANRSQFLESLLTRDNVLRFSYLENRFADATVEKLASGDMAGVPEPLTPSR